MLLPMFCNAQKGIIYFTSPDSLLIATKPTTFMFQARDTNGKCFLRVTASTSDSIPYGRMFIDGDTIQAIRNLIREYTRLQERYSSLTSVVYMINLDAIPTLSNDTVWADKLKDNIFNWRISEEKYRKHFSINSFLTIKHKKMKQLTFINGSLLAALLAGHYIVSQKHDGYDYHVVTANPNAEKEEPKYQIHNTANYQKQSNDFEPVRFAESKDKATVLRDFEKAVEGEKTFKDKYPKPDSLPAETA